MNDNILNLISTNKINERNISFDFIRKISGIDSGIQDELARGHQIISTEAQLDQYLYSYGLMAQSQWKTVLHGSSLSSNFIQINDYACGQGLASILFRDSMLDLDLNQVINVNLIEISAVALNRAKGLVECCYPYSTVTGINKYFDDIQENEITLSDGASKIHLFSNILDIEGFNQISLFHKILSRSGRHCIVAVSHDRGFKGGSPLLQKTYETLTGERYKKYFKLNKHFIERFECQIDTPRPKPAIMFFIDLEVYSESIF